MCNVEISLRSTKNWRNYLDEFEIFLDICTAQKDYAYIVTLRGLHRDDYLRATVEQRRCKKYVVRKTLREKCCEKDVVRMKL